jgi:hypothetical protein
MCFRMSCSILVQTSIKLKVSFHSHLNGRQTSVTSLTYFEAVQTGITKDDTIRAETPIFSHFNLFSHLPKVFLYSFSMVWTISLGIESKSVLEPNPTSGKRFLVLECHFHQSFGGKSINPRFSQVKLRSKVWCLTLMIFIGLLLIGDFLSWLGFRLECRGL